MNGIYLFPFAGLISLLGTVLVWRRAQGQPSFTPNDESLLFGLLIASVFMTASGIMVLEPISARMIHFTLPASAAVATLLVQCMYLIGLFRFGIQGLGLFLLPVTALPLLAIPFLSNGDIDGVIHTSSLLETGHLMISMLAYAVLTMAAFYAWMHLLLDHALRRKRLTATFNFLPSLIDLERMMLAVLQWSAGLIALSIVSGLSWQWFEFSHFAILNHKVILALLSFATIVVLLVQHRRAGWSGRFASKMVLSAYALLLLAYFGVKMVHSWM
jgi:ABC-type uncharacterized transport system permease subunit